MKIQKFHVYLRPLHGNACPLCGEHLERRPRLLWQKALSFALPLRHYKCSECNRRFFAFSSRWNRMHIVEKIIRVAATVAGLLIALFASLIIIWEIMVRLMV